MRLLRPSAAGGLKKKVSGLSGMTANLGLLKGEVDQGFWLACFSFWVKGKDIFDPC